MDRVSEMYIFLISIVSLGKPDSSARLQDCFTGDLQAWHCVGLMPASEVKET